MATERVISLCITCEQCGEARPRTAYEHQRAPWVCVACTDAPRRDRAARANIATVSALRALNAVEYPTDAERPKTRGDCVNGPRPCPWVSCRHHLYADVTPAGTLSIPRPGPLEDLPATCSLDVADEGPQKLQTIGDLMGGITRERARQIELGALASLRRQKRRLEQLRENAIPEPRQSGCRMIGVGITPVLDVEEA